MLRWRLSDYLRCPEYLYNLSAAIHFDVQHERSMIGTNSRSTRTPDFTLEDLGPVRVWQFDFFRATVEWAVNLDFHVPSLVDLVCLFAVAPLLPHAPAGPGWSLTSPTVQGEATDPRRIKSHQVAI